ncbi:lysophospholipid acyltransferase family protein [Novosphingobium bradum]|uniref:Lysophospholipid acyltransferase family protein n=1 Tax=Novosphingobium bradum TaxID=1737444 RepID=A0ABV7IMB5_9SPHN
MASSGQSGSVQSGSGPATPVRATRIGLAESLRIQGRLALIILVVLASLPLHYLCRAVSRHSPMPRLVLRAIARIVGARVRVVGTPLRRDAFLLANHVSWLDIPALAGASGTAFVAKAEVARVPVVGWLARLNHTVFVQREARLGVAAQINALSEALADNHAVAIFPEGTTTDGQSLLPFKTAMLKVLEPAPPGILVQPVLIDYGPMAPIIGWVGDEPGLANALRLLARPGSFPVAIHFLEPFSPDGHAGRKAIAAEARARIEAALELALGRPPRPFALPVEAVRYVPPAEAHDRAAGED